MEQVVLKEKTKKPSVKKYCLSDDNITYAERLAQRFYSKRSHSPAEIDDIISSAYVGLCEAANRFDRSRSDTFNTFCYLRIVGSMYDYLRTSGGVSRHNYNRFFNNDIPASKRSPNLRYALNLDELDKMKTVIEAWGVSVNIDRETGCVELTYVDQELPDAEALREIVMKKLRSAILELPDDMQHVLRGRYFEGKTLDELAANMPGITRTHLSRLHSRALFLLRSKMAEHV